jgi:radical SAM superfamily enzyme YgiQ (UPF0313 family)
MIKNVYLVQVVDYYGPNRFLPLAISYQWLNAVADDEVSRRYRFRGCLIEKLPIDDWAQQLDHPDVMIMSTYIWNWEYNRVLAQRVKQRWPDCLIIVGGPQIPKQDPDFVRNHPYFDVAVLGENEDALPWILLHGPEQAHELPGVVTKNTVSVTQPPRTVDLNSLPSPILSGFYDQIMSEYSDPNILWQVTYETMRGCPYHCSFCDIGENYWNKTYLFDEERIKKEIQWMADRRIEYISVCDSNWGMFERDKTITQWVIDAKLKTGYPKFWDVTWAKNNTQRIQEIAMMDQSADTRLFRGITFSLQSNNPDTLKSVKRFNLQPDTIYDAMRYFKEKDIPTFTELIWPMPRETLDSLKRGIQFLFDLGQKDFITVHPLVLTPNAPLGSPESIQKNSLQYRSVPLDTFWVRESEYRGGRVIEMVDAVVSTGTADFDTVIQGHMFAHWVVVLYYYGWGHAIINYLCQLTGQNETAIVDRFISYILTRPHSLFYQEHMISQESLIEVFTHAQPWGRLLDDGIRWEYKSATCVTFHHNRSQVWLELNSWLRDCYGVSNPDLIKINELLCADWRVTTPVDLVVDPKTSEMATGIYSDRIRFDHWDRTIDNDDEFVRRAYHYQRKSRYWKRSVCAIGKNSDT